MVLANLLETPPPSHSVLDLLSYYFGFQFAQHLDEIRLIDLRIDAPTAGAVELTECHSQKKHRQSGLDIQDNFSIAH